MLYDIVKKMELTTKIQISMQLNGYLYKVKD